MTRKSGGPAGDSNLQGSYNKKGRQFKNDKKGKQENWVAKPLAGK